MACIHYRFPFQAAYKFIPLNGLQITVGDLKVQIMKQEHLKSSNSDLKISNDQDKGLLITKKIMYWAKGHHRTSIKWEYALNFYLLLLLYFAEYTDETTVLEKYSSVIVRRIPIRVPVHNAKVHENDWFKSVFCFSESFFCIFIFAAVDRGVSVKTV